jgi:hypothetical protein
LIAALGTFGIYIALSISSPIISIFSDQAWVLTYLPGGGAYGTIEITNHNSLNMGATKVISTGTDSMASNLINYVLYPSADVTFRKMITGAVLYAEPLSLVLLKSIIVALAYIFSFSLTSLYVFRRTQVFE